MEEAGGAGHGGGGGGGWGQESVSQIRGMDGDWLQRCPGTEVSDKSCSGALAFTGKAEV